MSFDGEHFDFVEDARWDVIEDVGGEVVGAENGEGPEAEVGCDLGVEGAAGLGEDVKVVELCGMGVNVKADLRAVRNESVVDESADLWREGLEAGWMIAWDIEMRRYRF